MEHHYLLTVLRLPGNVEAELSRLQQLVFSLSGAVSSQALPPAVVLAGRALDGRALDGAPGDATSRSPGDTIMPDRLPAPLVIASPHARARTICMDSALALVHDVPTAFPAGVAEARLRVLLAVLPGGATGVCEAEPMPDDEGVGPQAVAGKIEEAWSPGAEVRSMTVRRVWEEEWFVSSTSEPWWCSVDFRVTNRRALRTAGE
ncbi:MAG: hypothetical protein ACOCW3_03380 [Spirochaetota bacterium]